MADGIEHGFRPTFWSGTPEPNFLHLGPPGTYDTEPEVLVEQNLAADEKRRQEAAERIGEVLPPDIAECTD